MMCLRFFVNILVNIRRDLMKYLGKWS